ncbi:hypothetical protein [Leptospira noguchii]|uniref:hypothetical protein n=1 Tax=Leptospira noguchii TaxID=28182 RepID=UPI0003283FC3|nr:hypothetical protein [Leptospira noguchii]EMS84718.1 hypothetical protein LEP1GSC073_1773 [Leptospira noguchii str. Cascata]
MKKFTTIEKINDYFKKRKNETITTVLDSKLLGRPGLINNLIIVGQTAQNPTRGPIPEFKAKRPFEIKCAISSVPPLWESKLLVGSLPVGRALLRNEANASLYYTVEAGNYTFYVYLDKDGYLSSASSTIEAENWGIAVKEFNSLLNPFLSKLSWQYNVPLTFSHINVYDKVNDLHYIKFVQAFDETNFEMIIGSEDSISPKIQTLYSFYREMINSTSPSYRFLCIYKALMIANLIKKEIEDNIRNDPSKLREFALETMVSVEKDDVNEGVWPECIGYKLNRLIDQKIRPLRNKVAHEFLDNESEFSNPDVGIFKEQIRDYGDALIPLLKEQIRLLEEYIHKLKRKNSSK